jgi:NAD-dependent dihydropyrimidine dehydrogenase PreA subunit
MVAVVDFEKCNGCASCVEVCPMECIELNGDEKAVVDADTCGDCGACADECPNEAITID